jgi:hypothetical protein
MGIVGRPPWRARGGGCAAGRAVARGRGRARHPDAAGPAERAAGVRPAGRDRWPGRPCQRLTEGLPDRPQPGENVSGELLRLQRAALVDPYHDQRPAPADREHRTLAGHPDHAAVADSRHRIGRLAADRDRLRLGLDRPRKHGHGDAGRRLTVRAVEGTAGVRPGGRHDGPGNVLSDCAGDRVRIDVRAAPLHRRGSRGRWRRGRGSDRSAGPGGGAMARAGRTGRRCRCVRWRRPAPAAGDEHGANCQTRRHATSRSHGGRVGGARSGGWNRPAQLVTTAPPARPVTARSTAANMPLEPGGSVRGGPRTDPFAVTRTTARSARRRSGGDHVRTCLPGLT